MGKRLYVGNLPFSATEDQVRDHFGQAGQVEAVKLISDRQTGRAKGFGFVEMANDEDASKAISQFNGQAFQGRNLTVNEAKPMEPGRAGGGGRGGPRNRF